MTESEFGALVNQARLDIGRSRYPDDRPIEDKTTDTDRATRQEEERMRRNQQRSPGVEQAFGQ